MPPPDECLDNLNLAGVAPWLHLCRPRKSAMNRKKARRGAPGFLSIRVGASDQAETAAIALATWARLPSFSAATQMRPESTP